MGKLNIPSSQKMSYGTKAQFMINANVKSLYVETCPHSGRGDLNFLDLSATGDSISST